MKNFGKWIRSFNFLPSPRLGENAPKYDCNKASYLKWLKNADILIEDNKDNILQAEEAGIKGLLVGKPWNDGKLSIKEILKELGKLL
jgi:hypothetical protein